MAWDGVERRKKPRGRWGIGVPRQISIGEIVAVVTIFMTFAGGLKVLEYQQKAAEERMDRLERLICYSIRSNPQAQLPPDCQEVKK